MRFATKMIVTAACAATLGLSASAMAMGGMGGGSTTAASVYAVPTNVPPPPPDAAKAYCATSAGACRLHHVSSVGDACNCRVNGVRAFGNVVAQ